MSRYLVTGAVLNSTEADMVEVKAVIFEVGEIADDARRMVLLMQSAGSMCFQHGMTTAQARELAALLVQGAEALEQAA